jgi:predicted P-loop ATPase
MNHKISYLVRVYQVNNPILKNLDDFLLTIKKCTYQQEIFKLQAIKLRSKKEYQEEKPKRLPAAMLNGQFSRADNESFISSSGLYNVDIDGLTGDIEHHKEILTSAVPSIVYCFTSPSNEGLKLGLKIDGLLIKSDADFKAYFPQIDLLFTSVGYSIDKSCKDIKRACFVSADSKIYINYDASTHELSTPDKVMPVVTQNPPNVPQIKNNDCIAIAVSVLKKSSEGNRHQHRLKAGRLAGGFISGGLADEDLILDALIKASDEIAEGGITSQSEKKTLLDAIEHGKKTPIYILTGDVNSMFDEFADSYLAMQRNRNTNKIKSTISNICLAISSLEFCGYTVGYDTFKDQIMYHTSDNVTWQIFNDETYTELRIALPKMEFEEVSEANIKSAVHYAAKQNKFDSAQEWLSGLEWDGVPRVELFNHKYLSTIDTPYTKAVSLYTWTALAARVMNPGCQCDMVPVYEGAQGDGKSSAIVSMAPRITESTEISFLEEEDKAVRKMRGTLLVEISELRGIHAKDVESTKAFITRRVDKWIPKYKEFTQEVPRRCVFIGTTNSKEFLTDTTGNRRWLPMTTGKIDCKAIDRDRDQLWAEAVVIYSQRGICWQDAETLAVDVHEDYTPDTDTWTEVIQNYLKNIAFDGDVTTHEVLNLALEIDSARQTKALQMRVCAVLTSIGYKKVRRNVDGVRNYVWIKDPTA